MSRSSNARRSSAPLSSAAVSACSRSTIGSGVRGGREQAEPGAAAKPGRPASATRRHAAARWRGARAGDGERLQLARAHLVSVAAGCRTCTAPGRAIRSTIDGPLPLYGTCTLSMPARRLEELADEVVRRVVAGRRVIELAGVRLRVGDELAAACSAGTAGSTTRKNGTWPTSVIGCRSFTGSYVHRLHRGRRDRHLGRRGQQQRVAVRLGAHDDSAPMVPPAPPRFSTITCWPSRLAEPLGEQARGDVGAAARRIRDDDAHRLGRPRVWARPAPGSAQARRRATANARRIIEAPGRGRRRGPAGWCPATLGPTISVGNT